MGKKIRNLLAKMVFTIKILRILKLLLMAVHMSIHLQQHMCKGQPGRQEYGK